MKCEQMPLEANGKRMALWYLCAERATEIKLFVKTFAESHNVKYGERERVSEKEQASGTESIEWYNILLLFTVQII